MAETEQEKPAVQTTPISRLVMACMTLRDEDALPPIVMDRQTAERVYRERMERNLNAVYLALDEVLAEVSERQGMVRGR